MFKKYLLYKLAYADKEIQPYLNKRVRKLLRKMDSKAYEKAIKTGVKPKPLKVKVFHNFIDIFGDEAAEALPAFMVKDLAKSMGVDKNPIFTNPNGIFVHPELFNAVKGGRLSKKGFNYLLGHELTHNVDPEMISTELPSGLREVYADVGGNYLSGSGRRATGAKNVINYISNKQNIFPKKEILEGRFPYPSSKDRISIMKNIKPETGVFGDENYMQRIEDTIEKLVGNKSDFIKEKPKKNPFMREAQSIVKGRLKNFIKKIYIKPSDDVGRMFKRLRELAK